MKLKEDSGNYFRDPNAARYPRYPSEPAVQALLIEQPDFPTTSVDVFACGNTMANLLRFVRKMDRSFRFLVEVVGGTVFFIRRENSPTEVIPDVRGYGHTFPEAYTTWEADVEGSESHQRIVKYSFGGLEYLVRFESDGYLREKALEGESRRRAECYDDKGPTSLSEIFSLTSLGQKPSVSSEALTVERGGQRIPQEAIFDLKTRSARKKDQDILAEELPRLWVAQIPNFVLAYHTSGVFEDIRIQNVRGDIDAWETENEHILRQFALLIQDIVTLARSRSDGKLEIRGAGNGILEVRKQAGDDYAALPPHIKAHWINEKGSQRGEVAKVDDVSAKNEEPLRDENEPDEEVYEWYDDLDERFDPDEDSPKDYTACSAEDCGYYGHCTY